MTEQLEQLADTFALGQPTTEPIAVSGGLSNEIWRVATDRGEFAVKRMIVNAHRPEFRRNIEAAFAIEQQAWSAGVPMPEPVPNPATGGALVRIDDCLFRVHHWVDGEVGAGSARDAIGLLARIHQVCPHRWSAPEDDTWQAEGWGADLTALARRVNKEPPDRVLVVDSHRDLDRKNTLRTPDGTLLAVDWDAAGPASAVHEAVAAALDWALDEPAEAGVFGAAVDEYARRTGTAVPAQPWIFAGWVASHGGWLDYNARHRANTASGSAEVAATSARLSRLVKTMDALLEQIC